MKVETIDIINGWKQYTLINDHGMKVSFLNFGGIITEIKVPDRNGNMANVVLAYKNLNDYKDNPNYFGALIGRVAGRIQNASFTLDNETYTLEKNDLDNHLHGGTQGFHQVIWNTIPFQTEEHAGVQLFHSSPDGSSSYPGTVNITVTYTLNNDNEFTIAYNGTTNKKTALSLTNHSYFNLSGNLTETIHNHHVTFDSEQFIELDESLIPTGNILSVDQTPFDFRNGRKLDDGIRSSSPHIVKAHNGYDHYFVFKEKNFNNVIVKDDTNGRVMTVKTDQPGMVMYTSNMLDEDISLTEGKSKKYLGVCFETQTTPASLHHKKLTSVVLEPNETYQHKTTLGFSVEK